MIKFYWRYPSMTYAHDWQAVDERTARAEIRAWLQVGKLPAGFEIWRASRRGAHRNGS